ncbi:hypothetical protein AU861_12395 [Salmonella enterica subsp. enterica serovar Infantis]|nr:hypothetical protein [Salmonella enterica subsp. enterica serovar Infantis]EDM3610473.1 hypothetical protein [Salmonella enterica subsp. enterica serovar Infantis]
MIFPCRHHFQADNKQPYSHAVKLPDGRSGQIRFSGVFELSGSVTRTRNKQSGYSSRTNSNVIPCQLSRKVPVTPEV